MTTFNSAQRLFTDGLQAIFRFLSLKRLTWTSRVCRAYYLASRSMTYHTNPPAIFIDGRTRLRHLVASSIGRAVSKLIVYDAMHIPHDVASKLHQLRHLRPLELMQTSVSKMGLPSQLDVEPFDLPASLRAADVQLPRAKHARTRIDVVSSIYTARTQLSHCKPRAAGVVIGESAMGATS
jgi:hypothetical protein